jgi:hypothetical protein
MKRIFVSLALVSNALLLAGFFLGINIGDPTLRDEATRRAFDYHFWTSFWGLIFVCLVHAIVLTYFMGTGRWMEETTQAYQLSGAEWALNKKLKYRTVPAMVVCLLLLVGSGALGAAADPASPVRFGGLAGLSAATVHFVVASVTLGINAIVSAWEYAAIARNHALIGDILVEVRRIRAARGLPVE